MTLGILVTTIRHLNDVIGITEAAVSVGHEVDIFIMDEAVNLLFENDLQRLVSLSGVSLAYCDVSTKTAGLNPVGLPEGIVSGSQLNNARMVRRADRVISL